MRRSHGSFVKTALLRGLLLVTVLPSIAATMGQGDLDITHDENLDQKLGVSAEERVIDLVNNFDSNSDLADPKPESANQGNLRSQNRNYDDLSGSKNALKNAKAQISAHLGSFMESASKAVTEFSAWTSLATNRAAGEIQKGALWSWLVLSSAASSVSNYSGSASSKAMDAGRIGLDLVTSYVEKGSKSIAEFSSEFAHHGKNFAVKAERVLTKAVQGVQSHSSKAITSMRRGVRTTRSQNLELAERRDAAIGREDNIDGIGQNEHVEIIGDHSLNWMMIVIGFACISFLTMSFVVVRRIRTEESNGTDRDEDEEMLVFEEASKFVADCCFGGDLEEPINNNTDDSSGMVEPETEMIRDDGRSTKIIASCKEEDKEEDAPIDISLDRGGDSAAEMTSSIGEALHSDSDDSQLEVASCLNLGEDLDNKPSFIPDLEEHSSRSIEEANDDNAGQYHSTVERNASATVYSNDMTHRKSLQNNSRSLSSDNDCPENQLKSKTENEPTRNKSKRTKMGIVQMFAIFISVLFALYITNILSPCPSGAEQFRRKKSYIGRNREALEKRNEL